MQACTPKRCWSATRDGCGPLRRSLVPHMPEFRGARSSSSIVSHIFGCSGARRTRTVQRLIGFVRAHRLINTSPGEVVSSVFSSVRWDREKNLYRNIASSWFTDWASPASRVSVAGSTPMSPSLSRSGLHGVDCPAFAAVSSTAGSSCLPQHDLLIAPTWLLPSAHTQFWTGVHTQHDTESP